LLDAERDPMQYFDIFEHPVRGVEAIKHGFSWPAFFLGAFWALFYRLWLPALLLLALVAVGTVICQIIGWPSEAVFLALAVWVFAGFHGNDWRRVDLSKRGFMYVGTERADTPDAAVATVMRKRQR
jgi:hypothetical protein